MIDDEKLREWAEQVNENNDIPGKRYDWSKDFRFTSDVINDLRDRGLLEMGVRIQVLVPVNREDAPTARQKGGGEIDKDGRFHDGSLADFHDYNPYDILHISLSFDHKNKSIGIDRYYGYRKDWVFEDGSTHRDWTAIPPISKKTVDSIMGFYRDRGVTEGLLRAIDDYVKERVEQDVDDWGAPLHSSEWRHRTEFEQADKRVMYRNKSTDPIFLKWLQSYIDKHNNSYYVKSLRDLCQKIESGEIFSYTYNFF